MEYLSDLVSGLPGVEHLYPATPILAAAQVGAERIGAPAEGISIGDLRIGGAPHPIGAYEVDGAVSVVAVVATGEDSALVTCRLVARSIEAFLVTSGHAVGTIEVTVGSIG